MLRINTFLFFLLAPILVIYLVSLDFVETSNALELPLTEAKEELETLKEYTEKFHEEIVEFEGMINKIHNIVQIQKEVFNEQEEKITQLSKISDTHKQLSNDIYEQKILEMLGPAIHAHISDNVEIKIFELKELGYRGFIAKVKLFAPKAFKIGVAQDKLGEVETVSSMAKRKGAILAINGGGFYPINKDGKKYIKMTANTVIDGYLIEPFYQDSQNFFFAGINREGKVIGTIPNTKEDITRLEPYQGVSFLPILLKDGKKVEIPKEWQNTKHPRTILGRYANDDLIMIVIDGRQGSWSIGVTLERLQDKLLELGVKDAYNLDGGGSSTFYYNGEVLNKPSDGKERPVVNSILIYP